MDIAQIIFYATSIIGGSTLIFRGLAQLAKLTKSEKDDMIIKKILNALVTVSSFVALNQKK